MATKLIDMSEILQLYEWYPIKGGCPKCKGEIVGMPSQLQRTGKQNLQVTNCPHCQAGIELVICKRKNGLLTPDLKGDQMRAKLSDTLVIPMSAMGQPADA